MDDRGCVDLLQWALPYLGMRWQGFRKVRRQVRRRIDRRIAELGLSGIDAYRARLQADEAEWRVLDALCRVTISRFFRDRGVWDALCRDVFTTLAQSARMRGGHGLACWSAGCASGEEAYSMVLCWHFGTAGRPADVKLQVLGTDIDFHMIERARKACYSDRSLRELPLPWREMAFAVSSQSPKGDRNCLHRQYVDAATWSCRDIRDHPPAGQFDLVMCRNLLFTYFNEDVQRTVLARIAERMVPGGALVIGKHEQLPISHGFDTWHERDRIFRKQK